MCKYLNLNAINRIFKIYLYRKFKLNVTLMEMIVFVGVLLSLWIAYKVTSVTVNQIYTEISCCWFTHLHNLYPTYLIEIIQAIWISQQPIPVYYLLHHSYFICECWIDSLGWDFACVALNFSMARVEINFS